MNLSVKVYAAGVFMGLALIIAPFAFAESESYREPTVAFSDYRAAVSSADSVGLASPVTSGTVTRSTVTGTSTVKVVSGNPTVAVSGRFSGAAGDTVVVACILYNWGDAGALGTAISVKEQTLTATAWRESLEADARFYSQTVYFDLGGATHYEIRCEAPSAGNVDLVTWALGADTK